MTRFIITAAALVFASTTVAHAADSDATTTYGATSKIISLGGHYTVHSVAPDGTVTVKTMTGEEAKLAASDQSKLALLSSPRR